MAYGKYGTKDSKISNENNRLLHFKNGTKEFLLHIKKLLEFCIFFFAIFKLGSILMNFMHLTLNGRRPYIKLLVSVSIIINIYEILQLNLCSATAIHIISKLCLKLEALGIKIALNF